MEGVAVQLWVEDVGELATVRATLRALAAGTGVERESDLVLAANELITNALMHARTNCYVEVGRSESTFRVAVTDFAFGELQPAKPASIGGRGLRIVAFIASRWGSERTDSGKRVWFEMDLGGSDGG